MRKSKKSKRVNRKTANNQRAENVQNTTKIRRRDLFGKLRNSALALAAFGGVGIFVVQSVQSSIDQHDLSKVGNGKPTIVQIHDPQCPTCRALQKETKQALSHFKEGQLNYAIANIRSSKGRAFANRYGVPHVTLLLFDKKGELKETLQGLRREEELRIEFKALTKGAASH